MRSSCLEKFIAESTGARISFGQSKTRHSWQSKHLSSFASSLPVTHWIESICTTTNHSALPDRPQDLISTAVSLPVFLSSLLLRSVAMLRTPPLLRQLPSAISRPSSRAAAAALTPLSSQCRVQQRREAHAISNPTLASIEKRWEAMPPQEQADLWMALRDRMKVDWNELTLQEKKAGMFLPCLSRSHVGSIVG